MKHYLSIWFATCLLTFSIVDHTYAQYVLEGIVLDSHTGQTLPFANISYFNGKQGTMTDLDGQFRIVSSTPLSDIEISYIGYERLKLSSESISDRETVTLLLIPVSTALSEVVIVAGENPALRIIKNAIRAREKNDPEQLASFSYMAFNKFLLTGDINENSVLFDTIYETDRKYRDTSMTIDSSNYYFSQFLEDHHLFLMESVSSRKFQYPSKNEEIILSSRVSGIKNPQFSFLSTEVQSFSFYQDLVNIFGLKYINPVSNQGLKSYRYYLSDTLFIDKDTVFTISYNPRRSNSSNLLKGVLYITTNGWAIQNVIAEPAEPVELQAVIHQKYEISGGHWFPVQLNYDLKFNNPQPMLKMFKVIGRSYISDIQINPDLSEESFSGYKIVMDENANHNLELLENYRPEMLDKKSASTYHFLDSISERYQVERRLGALSQISEGRIRWKYIAIDANRILRFNRAENIRLGLGLYTSNLVSRKFDAGGWFGYGFRDHTLKYGTDARWKAAHNLTFRAGYEFELYETGGTRFSFSQNSVFGNNNIRSFFIDQFDEVKNLYLESTYAIRPNLKVRLTGNRAERLIRGGYRYTPDPLPEEGLSRIHTYAIADLEIEYAPGNNYMLTNTGVLQLESKLPVYMLKIKKGFSGILGGQFDFWRVDFSTHYQFINSTMHRTDIRLRAGIVDAHIPTSYLFYMAGNNYVVDQKRSSLLAADDWAFETLYFNEFLSNRYISMSVNQEVVRRFFKAGKMAPNLEICIKALWGSMQQAQIHEGIEFSVPNLGFYEAGFTINKIYNTSGIGLYYRFGPYSHEDIMKNLAFRLTFRFQ